MVPLRYLHVSAKIGGHTCHHELLKGFENKPLVVAVEQEKPVPVDALEYLLGRWQSAKLKNF